MARWLKRLLAMVADPRPVSYSYTEAEALLLRLGFELAPNSGTSHRKFRKTIPDPTSPGGRRTIIIGLVQRPGPLKPAYVREMVRTLQENNLLPNGVE